MKKPFKRLYTEANRQIPLPDGLAEKTVGAIKMEAASSPEARPARRGGSAPPVSVVLLFRRLSQPPPSVWRFLFSRDRPGCRPGTFPPMLPVPGADRRAHGDQAARHPPGPPLLPVRSADRDPKP